MINAQRIEASIKCAKQDGSISVEDAKGIVAAAKLNLQPCEREAIRALLREVYAGRVAASNEAQKTLETPKTPYADLDPIATGFSAVQLPFRAMNWLLEKVTAKKEGFIGLMSMLAQLLITMIGIVLGAALSPFMFLGGIGRYCVMKSQD